MSHAAARITGGARSAIARAAGSISENALRELPGHARQIPKPPAGPQGFQVVCRPNPPRPSHKISPVRAPAVQFIAFLSRRTVGPAAIIGGRRGSGPDVDAR